MQERILTPEQVSQILQVHPFTVLKFIKQGKLKASKLGRVYRIRQSDLEYFLDHTSGRTTSPVNQEKTDLEEVPTSKKIKNKNKSFKNQLSPDISAVDSATNSQKETELPSQLSQPTQPEPANTEQPQSKNAKHHGDDHHYYILQ